MKPLNTIFLLLLSTFFNCNVKDHSSPFVKTIKEVPLQQVVDSLGQENIIGDNIGFGGSTYRFELYKQLNKIASTNELVTLTDHEVAAVRYYAFRALSNRHSDKVFEILLNHINDTTRVVSFSGCLGMTETLRYNLLKVVRDVNTDKNAYKLNKKESKIIDSILEKHPDPIMIPINTTK